MKYLGLKTAVQVSGKRVVSLNELKNSLVNIPVGTKGLVVAGVRDGKIVVEFDKCSCCGVSAYIGNLQYTDIELIIDENNNEPKL